MAVGRTQGKGFSYVVTVGMAALFLAAGKTAYDYRNEWVKAAYVDARTEAYFAAHPGHFCAFEGVWYDWDDDDTITLGCLEVKDNVRRGSYSSATGPRATSTFSMSGTYDIDSDSFMLVIGKDSEGKAIKFGTMIHVENKEYPTQMIVIDEKGEESLYIWQRDNAQMAKPSEQ